MEKDVQAFMAVYETRNFSVAARQLFISQPSVSVQINRLEQSLDMTLFVRNGRRQVQPTPAADQLYLAYKRLNDEWQQTFMAIKQLSEHPQMPAPLGFSQTTAVTVMPALMAILLPHTNYQFDVQTMNSEAVLNGVVSHKLAFGLIEKPMLADTVSQSELPGDQLVLAGQPNADLWLLREPGSGVRHYTDAYLRQQGITPAHSLVVDTNQSIMGLLQAGIGKTIFSEALVPSGVPYTEIGAAFHRNFYLIGLEQQPNATLRELRVLIENTLKSANLK